ncbi:MAG TPA: hypothetical protein PLO86_06200, partial [Syntrophales bacterium]|nr:hypothetical protein [Syntrophales bacterium]
MHRRKGRQSVPKSGSGAGPRDHISFDLKIHFSYVVPQKDGFVKALRPVPFEEASFRYYCGFTKHDGFVKSPYAVLPFFPR